MTAVSDCVLQSQYQEVKEEMDSQQNIEKIEHRLREINRLKLKLTFGNVPPFYHAVATSIGMAEGMLKYGFENSLDVLTDQQNWNLSNLGCSGSNHLPK